MTSPAARPTPLSTSSLASLIADIWTADTFDEVAETAAEAIVAAGPVSAARVRLLHTDTYQQAVAAVGIWPDNAEGGTRRLARMFARKEKADERPLRDKSGNPLGVLTTRNATDPNASSHDVEVTEILAAQAGLAAGYIRLLRRYQRLERWHAAQRAELHTLQRRWTIALDEAPIGMCTVGLQQGDRGTFLQVNDAFCDIVGSEPRELVGSRFEEFVHASDRQLVMGAVRRAADGRRTPATRQARLVPLGDQQCWVRITMTPVLDAERNPLFAVCHIQRVDGNREAAPGADPAAGPSHGLLVEDKIRLAAKRADRYEAAAALLLCDLGDLTQGDGLDSDRRQQLLATIAERLRGMVRPDDTVSDIDDHTLGLLLEDLDPVHAQTIAERVRKQLAELATEHGGVAEPSIGVTLIDSTSDPRRVLYDATTALRQARTSPSRVVLYARATAPVTGPPTPAVTTTRIIHNRGRRRRPRPAP
jgi:PAS domain S-box-containing protein